MAIETHQVSLHTADGLALVGDALVPDAPVAAVAICHPHPRFGGNRFNTVVDALHRGLSARGVATLRFDFRGVDGSEGVHDGGDAERIDAAAALAALGALTDAPIWLAGYSFGAAVALDTATPDLRGWLAVAPPLAAMPGSRRAAADDRPTHLLVAGHDQFSPPAPTAEATAGWLATTTSVLASADHFLAGHLDRVVAWAIDALGLDA
ncbi:MAG: alpha/beta fold hydrolase [Acidimicrobiales bacterium]|nr:alpha/beta fold hydrolase [Acidimicrobiales bacterium]MCB9395209.1 alpha/beta fold hydrolase [Acidimicrobiaceae bacterium]